MYCTGVHTVGTKPISIYLRSSWIGKTSPIGVLKEQVIILPYKQYIVTK